MWGSAYVGPLISGKALVLGFLRTTSMECGERTNQGKAAANPHHGPIRGLKKPPTQCILYPLRWFQPLDSSHRGGSDSSYTSLALPAIELCAHRRDMQREGLIRVGGGEDRQLIAGAFVDGGISIEDALPGSGTRNI